MKNFLLLFVVLNSLTIWSQKPDWLKPHPDGHSVFVQGILVDHADSTQGLAGTVTITNSEEGNQSYTIKANSMGVFQFHLVENGKYVVAFEFPGFISRRVAFDTFNVPDKAWKKDCMVDLKVNIDKRPEGFKDVVAMLPVATFQYYPEEKLFLFDIELTDRAMKRYQAELERALGNSVQDVNEQPATEEIKQD
ncbi:MAG: hypothetical protein RLY35_2160 [Bacteroidota bacterium]|jgi:hypothetical protein